MSKHECLACKMPARPGNANDSENCVIMTLGVSLMTGPRWALMAGPRWALVDQVVVVIVHSRLRSWAVFQLGFDPLALCLGPHGIAIGLD